MTKTADELKQLEKRAEHARTLLARLQAGLVEAGNKLGGEASLLMEANQQLVLSAIQAQEHAETAARSAELDVLTVLPNRRVLLDRLEQAMIAAKRHNTCVGLLFLDINNFKHINDTLGHGIGDKVLQHVALCLTDVVREVDTVSRHGGDEFLILLAEIAHRSDATLIADKIQSAFIAPYRIGDHMLTLTVSIGISLYPDHGTAAAKLIECADIAMYHAKRRDLGSHFYNGDEIDHDGNIELEKPSSRVTPNNLTTVDFEAESHLRQAKQLLEANEQLVIATLNALADTETANNTLARVEKSIEIEVATRAHQSKSEFLSRVSHELHTPLNAIMRLSQLMLMDDDESAYLDPLQRERLEAIGLAGQQLLSLTNDMLDIDRIEHDRKHLD